MERLCSACCGAYGNLKTNDNDRKCIAMNECMRWCMCTKNGDRLTQLCIRLLMETHIHRRNSYVGERPGERQIFNFIGEPYALWIFCELMCDDMNNG